MLRRPAAGKSAETAAVDDGTDGLHQIDQEAVARFAEATMWALQAQIPSRSLAAVCSPLRGSRKE